MVRFNFSQMVWDFSLTNMVGFGLSIYALHFQFHRCCIVAEWCGDAAQLHSR